jgi:hypothetical protein
MNRHLLVIAATVLTLGVPAAARAQVTGNNPYEGLFQPRRNETDPAIHHRFDVNLSVIAANDDDVLTLPATGVENPTDVTQSSGFNTTFEGNGAYSWQGQKVQFGASAATAIRYYTEIQDYSTTSSAGVGVTAEIARRTTLTANQTFAYSPPYLYGLFPSVLALDPGVVVASLNRGITRRGTLTVSADYNHTDYVQNSPTRGDVTYSGVSGSWQQGVSRNAVVLAGYRYRVGDLGFGGGLASHEYGPTVGFDYTKRLSPTRRAIFRANIGSTVIDIPESLPFGVVAGRRIGFTGDAGFDYYFGRSWQARASYRRGIEYVSDVVQPILADGFTAMVNGQLSPRVDLSVVGAYSNGESALQSTAFKVKSYTGDVRVRFALTRTLSAFGEYLYYFYDYGGSRLNAPNLIPGVERNGVRAGLTVWFSARRR